MLLFKQEHVGPIQDGRKTQTRRLWPHGPRVKVGSVHQARTRMLDKSSMFALLRVTGLRQERLGDISEADAQSEGYENRSHYLAAFCRINHCTQNSNTLSAPVWVVTFELVRE